MKRLYETFQDKEFKVLKKAKALMRINLNKNNSGREKNEDKLNWHDHLLILAKNYLKNHIHDDFKTLNKLKEGGKENGINKRKTRN